MSAENNISHFLNKEDFAKIKLLGTPISYNKGDLIFSDGDDADYIYFIVIGNVSIFIEKFTHQEEISTLGPGDYFGEMAFFNNGKRSASASASVDTILLGVDKTTFLNLYDSDQEIADKINHIFTKRNQELSFKEHLTRKHSHNDDSSFQIGIKGDPSLRFSAFSREKYDSVIDRIISDLQPRLYDLLINRSAYEIFIHCNSGEVHIRTVHDPFNGEIHPASKLLNIAYIERHFPAMAYEEKSKMIKQLQQFISANADLAQLPDNLQNNNSGWQPVGKRELANTISKLSLLRKIPNFYLRNFSISMINDTIRMQFNCDGTQLVNPQGLQLFIDQNLDEDEVPMLTNERRATDRRIISGSLPYKRYQFGERRSPLGRRQKDWESILSPAC